jgi:hypothetical protein
MPPGILDPILIDQDMNTPEPLRFVWHAMNAPDLLGLVSLRTKCR